MQNSNPSDDLLTNEEAAKRYLISTSTLNQSRCSGLLFKQAAPAYHKRGKRVFYSKSALDQWFSELPTQTSTAQNA